MTKIYHLCLGGWTLCTSRQAILQSMSMADHQNIEGEENCRKWRNPAMSYAQSFLLGFNLTIAVGLLVMWAWYIWVTREER